MQMNLKDSPVVLVLETFSDLGFLKSFFAIGFDVIHFTLSAWICVSVFLLTVQ